MSETHFLSILETALTAIPFFYLTSFGYTSELNVLGLVYFEDGFLSKAINKTPSTREI